MKLADEPLARRLRRVVRLACVVGALALAIGLLPGERLYQDSNNCFGNAVVGMFMTEDAPACTPAYDKLVETRLAGGLPLAIALVLVLLPGYFVYRGPRRSLAITWSLWTLSVGVLYLMFTFDLVLFDKAEVLWPQHAVGMLAGTLAVLVVVIAPLVAAFTRRGSPIPVATAS